MELYVHVCCDTIVNRIPDDSNVLSYEETSAQARAASLFDARAIPRSFRSIEDACGCQLTAKRSSPRLEGCRPCLGRSWRLLQVNIKFMTRYQANTATASHSTPRDQPTPKPSTFHPRTTDTAGTTSLCYTPSAPSACGPNPRICQ